MGSYVGIDLHRRRSVVVVLNMDGDRVSWSRIGNTPASLAAEVEAAGAAAEVAMEACWGWYWAADVIAECGAIWRGGGQQWLDGLRLGDVYVDRIESLRDLIELYDREIRQCDAGIHRRLKGHPGYETVQALRGVGPVLAAVFVAEIGD